MKRSVARLLTVSAVFSLLACLALLGTRGYFAISFLEPLQGQTRGAEYESLFPIWKAMTGRTLYTEITKIPYNGIYYNWLYYVAYAGISKVVLGLFALDHAWLPTVTRIFTLIGAVTGAVFMHLSAVRLLALTDAWQKWVSASLAASVFLGPLCGYFAIATTPDIWPMALCAGAIWLFMRDYERAPLRTVLAICVLSYLAWAFKQNFAYIPATIGLYLLTRRDWKHAVILTAVMIAAGLATLALGGSTYRNMLLFGDTHLSLTFEQLGINLFNMAVKTTPILVPGAIIAFLVASNGAFRRACADMFRDRATMLLPFLGVLVSAAEGIPTSAIVAAAENHYFHLIYFMALSILVVLPRFSSAFPAYVLPTFAVGFAANVAAIGFVLLGLQGSVSVRPLHDLLSRQAACLRQFSPSIFVDDPRLMLPWMVPANEHYVLEYSYEPDRAKGVAFEGGGVGGLIDAGRFEYVAILKWRGRDFDGSNLAIYPYRITDCHGLVVYGRNPSASAN
jgi:hypothetical protein